MKALLLFIALCGASCSMLPTPVSNGKGGSAVAVLVGGKGVLNYNADGSMAYTYSNEKSFQHAMQTVSTLGLSYIGYLNNLAKEVTSRYAAGQITIQQRDAGLAAIEQAKIAAGLTEATTVNPNIELPLRK